MSSEEEENIQSKQAMHALEEFVRILVKEYPLVFKDGSGTLKTSPKKSRLPYEASLEIKKK